MCEEKLAREDKWSHYCGMWFWVNRSNGATHVWYCNCGRCERLGCRLAWAKRRLGKICAIVKEYQLDKFFTLTLPRSIGIEEAWENISYYWSLMRKKLRRLAKKKETKFRFCAVIESHKDGYPHIHGFTDFWVWVEKWSEMWYNCCGGKIVWVEKVSDYGKISEYVNKDVPVGRYVGKENMVGALSKLCPRKRTLWRSKHLLASWEKNKKKSEEWVIVRHKGGDANESFTMARTLQALFTEGTKECFEKFQAWKKAKQEKAEYVERNEEEDQYENQGRIEQVIELSKLWCFLWEIRHGKKENE